MILADIYDLLNDVFFEVLRLVFITAMIALAIFLGVKLRKHHDKKKEMGSAGSDNDITDDTGSTMQ